LVQRFVLLRQFAIVNPSKGVVVSDLQFCRVISGKSEP
jgi:hypothetical protein